MTLSQQVQEYTNINGMKEHAGVLQRLRFVKQMTPPQTPEHRRVEYGIAYGPYFPGNCDEVTEPLQWQLGITDISNGSRLYWIPLDEYTEELNNAFMYQTTNKVIEL